MILQILEKSYSPLKTQFGPAFPFHTSRYEQLPPPPQPTFRQDPRYLLPPVSHSILKNKSVQETPPRQIEIKLDPDHQPDTQVKQKQFISIPVPTQSRHNPVQVHHAVKQEQLFQNKHKTVPVGRSKLFLNGYEKTTTKKTNKQFHSPDIN